MNNDNFLIEQDCLEAAQSVCRYIEDAERRSIGTANVLAASIASKYFEDIEADTVSGLHNIPCIFNDIEISDIYLNGSYIDVRIYFDEKEILVPKIHYDLEILPVAYMFIKLEDDLSGGSVTGFIFPENIDTSEAVNGYYRVDEVDFVSYYDAEARLLSSDDGEIPETFEKDVFDYLDGKLSDKKSFYKLLISSKYARETFAGAASVKTLLNGLKFDDASNKNAVEESSELEDVNESETLDELPEVTDSLDSLQEVSPLDELTSDGGDLLEEADTLTDNVDLLEEAASEELLLEEPLTDDISDIGIGDDDEQVIGFEEESANIEDLTELPSEPETVELDIADEVPSETTTEFDIQVEPENAAELEFDNNQPEEFDLNNKSAELDIVEEFNDNNVAEMQENAVEPVQIEEEKVVTAEDDEFKELAEMDYTTEITPSISTIEAASEEKNNDDTEITEDLLEASDSAEADSQNEQEQPVNEQINDLFDNGYEASVPVKKKKGSVIPLLGFVAVIAAVGYFGYTKFYLPSTAPETFDNSMNIETPAPIQNTNKEEETAMPVETVENVETNKVSNEGTANSIPAIEQNLDASIDVSNLSVNWEVPASYTTNATAKRYFVRVGKILQLNLKTELLLLSTSPITNKISVELEFNKDLGRFEIKNLTDSSGVPAIDKVIKETATKTLNMNLNMNMSVFGNLQGNPVLVIKL